MKLDYSFNAQAARRDDLWQRVRKSCHGYFDEEGHYDGNAFQPGKARAYDQRIVVELAMPLLHGDADDRALAERALRANDLMIGHCAFNMDYALALWHTSNGRMTPETRAWLLDQIVRGSVTDINATVMPNAGAGGYTVYHNGYNLKGVQWHGYNDNHVAMGTSSLILAGELIGQGSLVEAGRASLLNMRDTLQRRGFIHECNDCYLPHTMYPLAAIACWSTVDDLRELATEGLARIWSDLLGHWHPELGRKIGPSARDYTEGRLSSKGWLMLFHYVFGPAALPGWLNIDDIFEAAPPERRFTWPHEDGRAWNLGFIARVTAQPFLVPDYLAPLVAAKAYPFEIIGTNETGNMLEIYEEVKPDGSKVQHGTQNVQFAGSPHLLTTYLEEDWGMGSVDTRMIGSCPNNNWQVSYRKARPLDYIRNQGSWYCSYTINHKAMAEEHHLQVIEGMPESGTLHGPIHFADAGRFATVQHRRTAIVIYRPRPLENWQVSSLALTLLYPKHYGNEVDELWFGDERVDGWSGECPDIREIFVKDGPVYLGFRPLISPWLPVDGPEPLPCPVRLRADQANHWGMVHLYSYQGSPVRIAENDLSRIGNGFIVEVATERDFANLDAFKAWFRKGQVVDDTFHWQRLIRYHRDAVDGQEKLDLALRWDAWQDRVIFRALNGRTLPEPQFSCTNMNNMQLPWLTGEVSDHDNFNWLPTLINRPQHRHGHQPLPLSLEPSELEAPHTGAGNA
ncbi:MAG: hypothetical protein ACYC7E_15340 [Armatimonadota bacterium]